MPRYGWNILRKLAARFVCDSRGNVAIIFGICVLPFAFAGAAIDYSRANSVKVSLQNALDETALMLSKEAGTDSSTTLQTNATNYFMAQFTRPEATNVKVNASYTTSGGIAVSLTGSADVPTVFLGVIGEKIITVNSSNFAYPVCCQWENEMGLMSWLRGEPSPGDDDYDLYHRVNAQLGHSKPCSSCGVLAVNAMERVFGRAASAAVADG